MKAAEKRIAALEGEIRKIKWRDRTLYHRYYALAIRRAQSQKDIVAEAHRLVVRWRDIQASMKHLRIIANKIRKGKQPVYLTLSERQKLLYFLRYNKRRAKP